MEYVNINCTCIISLAAAEQTKSWYSELIYTFKCAHLLQKWREQQMYPQAPRLLKELIETQALKQTSYLPLIQKSCKAA